MKPNRMLIAVAINAPAVLTVSIPANAQQADEKDKQKQAKQQKTFLTH